MSSDGRENWLIGACIALAIMAMACLWLAWDYL